MPQPRCWMWRPPCWRRRGDIPRGIGRRSGFGHGARVATGRGGLIRPVWRRGLPGRGFGSAWHDKQDAGGVGHWRARRWLALEVADVERLHRRREREQVLSPTPALGAYV